MDADDLSWRFDVMTRYPTGSQGWRPFTAEYFPKVENNSELGIHEFPDLYETDVVERLHDELDNALAEICSAFPHTELIGIRILLWRSHTAQGDPDMILEATRAQLQIGKLRAAAFDVAHAEKQLQATRRKLRRVIADGVDQADAETVFAETENHLPDEDLVAYLAGARILRSILFNVRNTDSPSMGEFINDEQDATHTGQNFYWHRLSRFGLGSDGVITVQVFPNAGDEWGRLPDDDPAEEERIQQEERSKLAAIAQTEAEALVAELGDRNLRLTTSDGHPAGVEELAAGHLLTVTA